MFEHLSPLMPDEVEPTPLRALPGHQAGATT
jgi:hypothetical protein